MAKEGKPMQKKNKSHFTFLYNYNLYRKVTLFPLTVPIATSEMTGKQHAFNMCNIITQYFCLQNLQGK